MNKCCIPANYYLDNSFIEVNHCLNAETSPNFIFIFPKYDCRSNIDGIFEMVLINYEFLMYLICYKKF